MVVTLIAFLKCAFTVLLVFQKMNVVLWSQSVWGWGSFGICSGFPMGFASPGNMDNGTEHAWGYLQASVQSIIAWNWIRFKRSWEYKNLRHWVSSHCILQPCPCSSGQPVSLSKISLSSATSTNLVRDYLWIQGEKTTHSTQISVISIFSPKFQPVIVNWDHTSSFFTPSPLFSNGPQNLHSPLLSSWYTQNICLLQAKETCRQNCVE